MSAKRRCAGAAVGPDGGRPAFVDAGVGEGHRRPPGERGRLLIAHVGGLQKRGEYPARLPAIDARDGNRLEDDGERRAGADKGMGFRLAVQGGESSFEGAGRIPFDISRRYFSHSDDVPGVGDAGRLHLWITTPVSPVSVLSGRLKPDPVSPVSGLDDASLSPVSGLLPNQHHPYGVVCNHDNLSGFCSSVVTLEGRPRPPNEKPD